MTAVADSPGTQPGPESFPPPFLPVAAPVAQASAPVFELPGWNIAANVMPPEVTASRRAQVVLRAMFGGLVVLLLLCGAGYWYAHGKANSAAQALAAEQDRASALQAAQNKYAPITRIKADTQAAQQQLAQLMANDASLSPLLASLQARLPAGGTITQVTVTLSGSATSQSAGTALVTTPEQQIGTVTFSGTMPNAATATAFGQSLTANPLKGLLLPYPGSTTIGADGKAQYSISATLTAALLTHQYDVKAGK